MTSQRCKQFFFFLCDAVRVGPVKLALSSNTFLDNTTQREGRVFTARYVLRLKNMIQDNFIS